MKVGRIIAGALGTALLASLVLVLMACTHAAQQVAHRQQQQVQQVLRQAQPSQPRSYERATRCTEDMACWDCHTMGNHQCGRPVPTWLSCNVIDGSEFPHLAALAWRHCYININNGAHWRYIGRYDGKAHVWAVGGPTSVYVTRAGWWVTS